VTVDGRRLVPITPLPTRVDAVWDALLEAVPDVSTRPEALDAYTPALRQLHAMSLLTAEVNNGGFSQFFFNGGGMWVDDAIAGWAAAGLPAHEELTLQLTVNCAASWSLIAVNALRGSGPTLEETRKENR